MFRHVIFDLDGTILDTNETIFLTFEHVLQQHLDYAVKRSELMKIYGQPLMKQMSYFSPGLADLLCDAYRKYYVEKDSIWTKAFPGVTDTLAELQRHGIMMGVVTNKSHEPAERALHKFGLWPYLNYLIAGDDVANFKPHPEALLKACDLMQVTPAETIMVGDSPVDLEAAHNSGIQSALVPWSIFPPERFDSFPPDYRLHQLNDLLTILQLDVA